MSEAAPPIIDAQFKNSLEGQRVIIPSIYKLVPEWKPTLHEKYKLAREESLDPWIRRWVVDKDTARALCAADFGRFAAVWVPNHRPYEILCSASKYFAWYFVFDDIFDCGSLKYNQLGAQRYRDASLDYFRFTLLGQGIMPDLSSFDLQLQNALHCWDEVGDHIRENCSQATREVLCTEMLRYVQSLNNVDIIFKDNKLPSVEQYWERREATAAALCVVATIPFVYGMDVEKSVCDGLVMRKLWKHCSSFVHISNDMFSFRKEMMDDQFENLIPILMLNNNLSCNVAMQESYELLRHEVEGLRHSRALLTNSSKGVPANISAAFIQGCYDIAMGLAHWSYCGARYLKDCDRDNEDVISYTIQKRCRGNCTVKSFDEQDQGLQLSKAEMFSMSNHVPPFASKA
ncbi:hypothetical protein PDE_06154 [Penicillium oxalicum 114-2]|uniref:Terpene synthase n=1 Tax=Penicillium oxalicum (strain 114-2 / CGMCC 5302) TaxID=933388 RepID=S7ZLJ5_PENO1|nr:hypothetical protein PDE_06154 [Penicillium oxalicum 114-2]